ncbi:MAG: PH domain-containing protein [Nocardioidaceae bacterium]
MPAGSDPAPIPGLPLRIRPLGIRMVLGISGVMLVVLVGAIWFALPSGMRDRFSLFQAVTYLILFAIVAVCFYAVMRSRLDADEQGITIVNGFKERRYEWAQVVAVHLGRGAPWASLDISDGTTVSALAIQTADGARATRQVRELRALIDQHTQPLE